MLTGRCRVSDKVKHFPWGGIVGPSSVGKSEVMRWLETICGAQSLAQVKCRGQRIGEKPSEIRIVSNREFYAHLSNPNTLACCSVDVKDYAGDDPPDVVYETVTLFTQEDIEKAVEHSMDTGTILLVQLDSLDAYGWWKKFPDTRIFMLTTPPDVLLSRHWDKYPDPDDRYGSTRLLNALRSLVSPPDQLSKMQYSILRNVTDDDLANNTGYIYSVLRDLLDDYIAQCRG